MEQFLAEAKSSSRVLGNLSGSEKNRILREMANALRSNTMSLLEANAVDMQEGKKSGLSLALMDRLVCPLTPKRVHSFYPLAYLLRLLLKGSLY